MSNVETTDTAAAVAEQGATVPMEKASATKGARQKKVAPKATKSAPKGKKSAKPAAPKKGTKTGKKATAKPERTGKPERIAKTTAPRAASKGAQILEMIGQGKGATLAEIMKATGWQAHSVRGFISTAGKKHNVKIESSRTEAGDRLYRIEK